MRLSNIFLHFSLILTAAVLFSCSGDNTETERTGVTGSFTESEETFSGWNSVVLRNAYVRLDIVPELGGKIMGYSAFGNQILWHNPVLAGQIDPFYQNDLGEEFINCGGAKVWPAPQGDWGGPPDNVLDGSPYEYNREGNTVTVTGPEDNEPGRSGIQYQHSYTLIPRSTYVDFDITMRNCVSDPIEWSLWHLSTVPADKNITIYVPVDEGDWEVMHGDRDNNEQWLGVENGIFRARPNNRVGKVGMMAREGWAAMFDHDAGIVYAIFYPLEEMDSNGEFPHGGHNFEIWSTGAVEVDGAINPDMAHMELEVLAPLAQLTPDESTSLHTRWAACKASAIKKVLPSAVISEEFALNNGSATGKFGSFQAAIFAQELLRADGSRRGFKRIQDVNPMSEVSLNVRPIIPGDAARIRYLLIDKDENVIQVLTDIKIKPEDITA